MRLVTLSIILSVIAVILAFINVCIKYDKYLEYSNSKKNNTDDEEDEDTFQKAIIFIGNEKIEIEVDYCYIDDSTTRIESKYGKVYLTDIKNVVLISDKKEIF
ncbi:hypothetical protein [Clostridium perfringens]|uniref:hypothetical protein n=1 Tax=Clostridium perfringens TaxID=1502 RepID=UPI0024BC0BFE|nr:hypothetical protein [Clostridium perfringens]